MSSLIKYLTSVGNGLDEVFGIKGEKLILSQKETDIYSDGFTCRSFYNIDSINKKFGLILGNFPLGLAKKEWNELNVSINIVERENWLYIIKSLLLLDTDGFGVFPIEPCFFESEFSKKFKKLLIEHGFKIELVLNLPKNVLQPETSLQPYLLIFSRGKQEGYFIAEISDHALETITYSRIRNIIENKNKNVSSTLRNGIIIDDFEGFNKYKIKKEIDFLEKEYSIFSKVSFNEIINNLIIGKSISEKTNSLYISQSGEIYQYDELDKNNIKKSIADYAWGNVYFNYARIDFDETKCLAEYMKLFFKSNLGEKLLNYLKSSSVIPKINFKDILTLQIPLPDLSFQKKIIELSKKMDLLIRKTAEFKSEVAVNPSNYEKLEPNLNQILHSLDMLSEEDEIRAIIKNGEDKQTEFKSSLRKSVEKEGIPDAVIEKNVLRTIAGFLNSDGGNLIIGVDDKQQIWGLEHDGFSSNDKILLHLKNLITRDIGIKFIDLIKYNIVNINKKNILVVNCQASIHPVFLGKKEEFYVRTNPATDELTGKKLYEYIQNHFGGNK